MENKKILEKNMKPKYGLLVAACVFFGLSLIIALSMFITTKNEMKNPKNLLDVKTTDVYSKIDVVMMTDYFATNEEQKSYFVWDDKYLYIATLDDKTRDKLQKVYDYSYQETDEVPETVEITGTSTTIPSSLKKLAIEYYNELVGENVLTSSNFSDYFGTVYLDTNITPMNDLGINMVTAVPTFAIGLIFLIFYLTKSRNTKKSLNKYNEIWDKIVAEVDSNDAVYYKKAKIFLTRSYVISHANGLEIYEYKNIVWVYPYEYRYRGNVTQKSIYLITKDSKAHQVGNVSASKANLIVHDELYNTLTNKMPDVLSGYTKENKEKAKTLYEK